MTKYNNEHHIRACILEEYGFDRMTSKEFWDFITEDLDPRNPVLHDPRLDQDGKERDSFQTELIAELVDHYLNDGQRFLTLQWDLPSRHIIDREWGKEQGLVDELGNIKPPHTGKEKATLDEAAAEEKKRADHEKHAEVVYAFLNGVNEAMDTAVKKAVERDRAMQQVERNHEARMARIRLRTKRAINNLFGGAVIGIPTAFTFIALHLVEAGHVPLWPALGVVAGLTALTAVIFWRQRQDAQ